MQAREYCVSRRRPARWAAGFSLLALAGCIRVGPDYTEPQAPVAPEWTESDDQRVATEPLEDAAWWRTFDDPVLSALVDMAPTRY